MNSMKKRLMSLLLAVCMAVSALPTTALALRGDGGHPAHKDCSIEDAVEQPVPAEEPETPAEEVPPEGEAPAQDEPAVDEPTADEPAVDDPAVDDPTVDDPTTDEPVGDDSLPEAEEPAPEEVDAADEPVPLADAPQSEAEWIDGLENDVTAVIVTTFDGLAAAVKNENISDIVLSAGEKRSATWNWTSELAIDREVHITVAEAETVTLMRANGALRLFDVDSQNGHLILGDGSISTMVEPDLQNGDYEVIPAKTGELIIDGGAVWKRGTASDLTAYFIDERGDRTPMKNTGVTASTALISCRHGELDIWEGVTLRNNYNGQLGNRGGAIFMGNASADQAPILNLYGGVVEWCATNTNENGSGGGIYCGNSGWTWTNYTPTNDNRFGTVNLYAGSVRHNANHASKDDHAGDGTGIAVDAGDLNMYGGSVSYNCGDTKCSKTDSPSAADGGGIGGRASARLYLYGGEISYNWTGGFGGGVCLWNSQGLLAGTEITHNTARFGGGVAIAGCNTDTSENDAKNIVFSRLTMTDGLIAFNQAEMEAGNNSSGVGGGICAGTNARPNGSVLDLSGGKIKQNIAQNGGGVAAYAGGKTALNMSGTAEIVGNTSYGEGGGAYFVNHDAGKVAVHHLLTMSGAARIDTQNTVYFENVVDGQIPVLVSDELDKRYIGTVGIFEFSNDFWTGTTSGYAHARAGLQIVEFAGEDGKNPDIQENKFGLDSTQWYLKAAPAEGGSGYLALQNYTETKQYWIRNGTLKEQNGQSYYRIYDDLDKAFADADSGDTLYIFYNAAMMKPAVLDGAGKTITLLAESSSSAGVAASLSGGTCEFDTKHQDEFGYYVMTGEFLVQDSAGYKEEKTSYNVRNDYTITLSGALTLNEKNPAAIVVKGGAALNFGQETVLGIGYGSLTFDGNYSYPVNGPMLQVEEGGSAVIHSGVTLTNHTNLSSETPGTVYNAGTFTMMDGAAITNGVSPMAGAVYNTGTFAMEGGRIAGSTGAMPRTKAELTKATDKLYPGQPKYYYGAGAVYAAGGSFTMAGGSISGSRGEWGAVAGLDGALKLTGGTISGNAAVQSNGTGEGVPAAYDLTISGYTDTGVPETSEQSDPGSGGGLYLNGSANVTLGGVTITGNWAQVNGGGVARHGGTLAFNGADTSSVTRNTAREMGGGVYLTGGGETTTIEKLILTGNTAKAGGGLAVLGAKEGDTVTRPDVTVASSIESNTAEYGGGVYAGAYANVTVEGASLQDNTAAYGGGAYIDCAKTMAEGGEQTLAPVDPGAENLGTDVEGSSGVLRLKNARVNNNHLSGGDNDSAAGFGGGAYIRGQMVLDKGAYASGNDRLYLEKGRVIELTEDYEGLNQNPENRLTINSRETALGTDVIKMANEDQYLTILTADREKVGHYGGYPMAQAEDKTVVELNFYTITYYDRLEAKDGLDSHHVTDMMVPGQGYTILSWDAANRLEDEEGKTKVLALKEGKSLGRWLIARVGDDGKLSLPQDGGAMASGESYTQDQNLVLVADFTDNNYLAIMLNELDGVFDPETSEPVKSDIGSVRLDAKDLSTSNEGQQSRFSTGMEMSLLIDTAQSENGHQKGILTSLTIYKAVRSAVTSVPVEGERTFGQFIYAPVAEAEFQSIELGGSAYENTGIPTGWKDIGENAGLSGTLSYKEGVLTYTGGTDNVMFVAKFAPPAVELKMTADGQTEPVLTEYYDTMDQAFTRLNSVMASDTDTAWGVCTITPLTADADGKVYYYGEGSAPANANMPAPAGANVVFDLNGYSLDLQKMPAQTLDSYHLTLQNSGTTGGEIFGGAATAAESQFTVNGTGALTLDNVTLHFPDSAYAVTVKKGSIYEGSTLELSQTSHAGKVLLSGNEACVTALEPKEWSEYSGLPGAEPAAKLYLDLGALNHDSGTDSNRQVIRGSSGRAASLSGHNLRSHFELCDTNMTDETGDDGPNWFIGTDGYLYPRIRDVIPRLICLKHDTQEEGEQWNIRTEEEIDQNTDEAKEPADNDNPDGPYYPVYYLYTRDYGYNNDTKDDDGHPLAIVTQIQDAYGHKLTSLTGVVTVTMAQVVDGQKNRVLTARTQTVNADVEGYVYTGTDANPVFPAGSEPYYLTGSFTGDGEYAAAYSDYWKVRSDQRADDGFSYMSGLSKLTINKKNLSHPSVVIVSVTPGSAGYIGAKGAANKNTSRAGTVRVRDAYTNLNLTSGDDLQNYYRKLTTVNNGTTALYIEDGFGNKEGPYYYADDWYYTATGSWYGPQEAKYTKHVAKIDGQDAGLYSVEVAAVGQGDTPSVNYTGVSGWKGQVFTITPYAGRLSTEMTNSVVIQKVDTEQQAVIAALKDIVSRMTITDAYDNKLDWTQAVYTFVPADSSAKVDAEGWPCAQGLYSIEVHPYDGNNSNAVTQTLVGSALTADANYSATAAGHQALLITKHPLTMEIQTDNDGNGTWTGDPLNVPYSGSIYTDGAVKEYDSTYTGSKYDKLQVVRKAESGGAGDRLKASQYTLQVGLPDEPARDSGRHVLVATDQSGEYVAIGAIYITRHAIAGVTAETGSAIYTGKIIDPKLTVTGTDGETLVEGRDYTVSIKRGDVATGLILNAGEYVITVAGKGNYAGSTEEPSTATVRFIVAPKNLDNSDSSEERGIPKVEYAVPSYNLDISRPKAVLTYNGMVLSPGTDYVQEFQVNDGAQNENKPDRIIFTPGSSGNYTGSWTVEVETEELPAGATLTIRDTNNNYIYQATDLFGYVNYQELTVEETQTRAENKLEMDFSDYNVQIATVADYYAAGGGDTALENAAGRVLDVDAYIVKMTRLDNPDLYGYFFMRVVPRSVVVKGVYNEKVYGELPPTRFDYTTNLRTLVGSGANREESEPHGDIDEPSGFFKHDVEQGYPTGSLFRAEGEDVGNYYYALNTFTAGPNYTLTVSSDTMFTIHPKSLAKLDDLGRVVDPVRAADDITVNCREQVEYTGYPVTPLENVVYASLLFGTVQLHESADYTLTYYRNLNYGTEKEEKVWSAMSAAPIAVGEYKVVVTGTGNYTNAVEREFVVVAAGKQLAVELDSTEVTYKADPYRPKVTVKTAGGAVLNSSNYKMTYSYTDTTGKTKVESQEFASASTEFVSAGTYTIHVNGTGNYKGAYGTAVFKIRQKDLGEANDEGGTQPVAVQDIGPQLYTGEAVTFEGLEGVTYAGLTTGGLGDKPAALKCGTDYDLTYMNNTNAGAATVILLGKGNYAGSRAVPFQIQPKTIYVELGAPEKTYGEIDPDYVWTAYETVMKDGEEVYQPISVPITGKPGRDPGEDAGKYTLSLTEQGSTLSAGSNYTLAWKDGTAPELTITPKAIGNTDQTAAERIGASIGYMEAKEGAVWPEPSVIYWAASEAKELTRGVDYEVTYYKVGIDGAADAVVTDPPTADNGIGAYYAIVTVKEGSNYTESIKLPFQVVKEGSYLAVSADPQNLTYSPTEQTVTLSAHKGKEDVTNLASYTVYRYTAKGKESVDVTGHTFKATDAGTYVVAAEYQSGEGDNATLAYGSTTVVVSPKPIYSDTVDVAAIPQQDYTGDAVVPKDLTITDGGKELEEGVDYTISVTGNVQPGAEATVTITGMGNYSGTRPAHFTVGPMQYTLRYDANGGSSPVPADAHSKDSFSVASGSGMTHANAAPSEDAESVPVLFIGWTRESNSGKIYEKGDNLPEMFYGGQTLTPETNVTTLHAVWGYDTDGDNRADVVQEAVKVVYDKGANTTGEPPKDEQTYLIGAVARAKGSGSLAYQSKDPAYVFMGWTSTPNGETAHAVNSLSNYLKLGGVYAEGAAFYVGKPSGGSFVLYPVWGVDQNGNDIADFLEGDVLLIYDANGGVGAPAAQECETGQPVRLSEAPPTRGGAVFLGWTAEKKDLLTEAPGTDLMVYGAGDLYTVPALADGVKYATLYALWAADENGNDTPDYQDPRYTVTYIAGADGVTVPASRQYLTGTVVTVEKAPTRAEYTFGGWKLNDTTTYQPGDTFQITQNITLTAQWTAPGTVTLTYYKGSAAGDAPAAVTVKIGGTATVANGLSREGYTFLGWTTGAEKTVDSAEALPTVSIGRLYQAGETLTLTKDTDLYPMWIRTELLSTYRLVLYRANGGDDSAIQSTAFLTAEKSVAVMAGEPVREGYTFGGWNTQADGHGTTYQPGQTFEITQNVTLYAVWTANSAYTVTYNPNGGEGTPPTDERQYRPGDSITVLGGDGLTREGAVFAGWSTEPYEQVLTNLSGVKTLYSKDSSFLMGGNNVTLYAVWATPEAMGVYCKMDFAIADAKTREKIATLPSEMFFKPGSTVNIRALQPYDLAGGYVFCGWSQTRDGKELIQDEFITITGDTTLYAVFATDTYWVYTQAGTGGDITPSAQVPYGGRFKFTVTVDREYELDRVTVNGAEVTLDSTNSYTIPDIQKDTYVMVTFTKEAEVIVVPTPVPTPVDPEPTPKPVTPDDTGVSSILNTRKHIAFMKGYADGTFKPEGSITRAEVAQMFYNLLLDQNIPTTVRFEDVPDSAWYADAVHALASLGMIGGTGNGRFEPDRAITRAEFSAIATRFAKQTTAARTSFADVPETHWAYQYINVAAAYGWVSGYGGNLFGPNDQITRAQAATMVNRMLGRLCDKAAIDRGEGRSFPDVTDAHWAWYQIGEAATEHGFTISEDYLSEIWQK